MTMCIILLLSLAAACTGATFQVFLIYPRSDCMGDPVQFTAQNAAPSGICIVEGCTASGLGGQIKLCVNGTTPVPPNNIECPTCSYCGTNSYDGSTTCSTTPRAYVRTALGSCFPSAAYFYKTTECTQGGTVRAAEWYTDNRCTVPFLPAPVLPSAPPMCVQGSPVCSATPATTSLLGLCQYATATRAPGNNQTGTNQTGAGERNLPGVLLIMIFVFILS